MPLFAPSIDEMARHFPQLEIIELLGQGGMGAVYKARQPGLDRLVAVKILPRHAARDPAFAQRFAREARALAKLNHPNIVAVYDFGQTQITAGADGTQAPLYYFIMEYVDGLNLRQLIRSGQCKPDQALRIVPQICEALQFAHDEGIVHRDIKPENILIDKRGRLKIADFGLARILGHTRADFTLTGPWQVMGTPNYMAPEQLDDPLHVDHRADIYALGVVFYEMLTGDLPRGRFAPPSHKVQVDVRLDEVVLRAMEHEPQRRYQQANEVKTEVETITRAPPPAVATPDAVMPLAPSHSTTSAESAIVRGREAVQGPADAMTLVAGAAILTAVGVGTWLWSQRLSDLSPSTVFTLTGMSVTQAAYGLLLVASGMLMRTLRLRFVALLGVVLVGLFVPAILALNVIMEFDHIPQWPVVLPMWLGVPVAVWSTVALFHRDVRAAFDATAAAREINQLSTPPARPRLVPIWAILNLLVALMLLFVYSGPDPMPFDSETPLIWRAWNSADYILGFAMSAGLFASSIGLLLWKNWARRLLVGLCVLSLALLVLGMPYHARALFPHLAADMSNTYAEGGVSPESQPVSPELMVFTIAGSLLLIGLPWQIGQLVYFTRPSVVASFQPSHGQQFPTARWVFSGAGAVVGILGVLAPLFGLFALATLFNKLSTGDNGQPFSTESTAVSEATRREGSAYPASDSGTSGGAKLANSPAQKTASLIDAAAAGDTARAIQLLDAGASVNGKNPDGSTALMSAVGSGHRSLAMTLVLLGADIMEQDQRGRTALMTAAERADSAFLSRLRDLSQISYERDAAQRLQKIRALPGIDHTLLADRHIDTQGFDLYRAEQLRDEGGENALMKAARAGDWTSFDLLATQVDTLLARDKLGHTVLMHAVLGDRVEQTEWLHHFARLSESPYLGQAGVSNLYVGPMLVFELERGISVLNNEGRSVLQLAEQLGRTRIAAILRRHLEAIIINQTDMIKQGGDDTADHYRLRALAWQALGEKEKAEADFRRRLPD
jgi:serine/threonine protein kinase/ankyrin repeat protein